MKDPYESFELYEAKPIFIGAIALVMVVLFASFYRSCSVGAGEIRHVEATVTDKGIKQISKSDVYLVYTKTDEGVEVFQITDSIIAGRFNSADVYASIEVGKTYDFGVRGERNELLSWYPNIYEWEEVNQ